MSRFFLLFSGRPIRPPGSPPSPESCFICCVRSIWTPPAALRPPLMIFVDLTSHEHPMHTNKLGPGWTAKSRIWHKYSFFILRNTVNSKGHYDCSREFLKALCLQMRSCISLPLPLCLPVPIILACTVQRGILSKIT